jgi:hypothetical protein
VSAAPVAATPPMRARPHNGPTADPAWIRTCIDVLALEARLVQVEGAQAPLARVAGRLELVGASTLFEPMDFAWQDEQSLDRLAAALGGTGMPLSLTRMPAESPAIAALRQWLPVVVERPAGTCPVLWLDGDGDTGLSSRRRQDLRRARRRAEAAGKLVAAVHEPTPDEVDRLLDVAFAVEARSWKGRVGTALARDALRAAFYRDYCRAAAAARTLRVALLHVDGAPAAMQLAVERDDALWLLKIGYDDRFAVCSPGQLLLHETIRWAARRGLTRCEFLGTAASWTRAWTRDEWACSWVLAYPSNMRGAVAAARDGVRLARKLART